MAGHLSKVSATALSREKRESKRSPKDAKEAEDRARDKRDAEKGAPILQKITETEYFRIMPAHRKAAWVRAHGRWPGEVAQKAKPIEGLSRALAAELVAFAESGKVGDDRGMNDPESAYPSVWRVMPRLEATKKRG